MNAAVIKVAFANKPKEGKKQGTVKTDEGAIYGVWPDKLGLLQPGRSYKIEFKEREYDGRTFRTITKCEPCEPAPALAEQPGDAPSSKSTDETTFIARVVSAGVASQQVEFNAVALGKAMRLAQSVYREVMRQSQA